MDEARALLGWRFVRVVLLALGLWLAIGEALDFRGPDPAVPRHVLEEPSEQDLGPKGCAPFC
jgi:hypothetical protein